MVQSLKVDSAYVYNKNEIYIRLNEDANFDGYKDLQLINWAGNHNQQTFLFWIFSPKNIKFTLNESLSRIINPSFDKKNKVIISVYNFGPSYHEVENKKNYVWEKGKAILDNGFETSPITGEVLRFYQKNGKMIYELSK